MKELEYKIKNAKELKEEITLFEGCWFCQQQASPGVFHVFCVYRRHIFFPVLIDNNTLYTEGEGTWNHLDL